MNDTELLVKSIDILRDSIGVSATVRLLSILQSSSTDYVQVSNKIYEHQSIDEIFSRHNWKKD